ncbi:MAG TPA: hypothetical protein DCR97_13305 [Deltaproteobacteria bacterium]|nr:hypothetical protein [Deltaproteobacteria bacterium]
MIRKCIACYLVAAMFVISVATSTQAAFSPSQMVLSPSMRSADMDKIQVMLENKLVKQRLQDLGFTSTEITNRLAQMSDQQIHSFAQKLDDLRVGGDGIWVVVAVLAIIALVILILKMVGHPVKVK